MKAANKAVLPTLGRPSAIQKIGGRLAVLLCGGAIYVLRLG
jgi:hypothetical protein